MDTAVDEGVGVAALEVNGAAVPVGADGSFATVVTLADGENTLTVVATDAFGNKRTEVRRVRLFPYSADWNLTGRYAVLNAFLQIEDRDGRWLRVDAVTLVIRDATGGIVYQQPMTWLDEKYKLTVLGLGTDTFTVWGEAQVAGWRATLFGGEVRNEAPWCRSCG